MRRSSVLPAIIAAVLTLLAPGPRHEARAHPHVWIDTRATLRFDEQSRLAALVTEWIFDEVYASFVIEDLEKDADGGVAPETLQPLADQNVRELAEWGYFTVLKVDGGRIKPGPAEGAAMRYADGRLTLSFVLPLPEPIDPRRREIAFSIFDPTFYIEIVPAERDPVLIEGAAPPGCAARLRPLESEEERYIPDSFALSVETDPNDPENGIGARFAEWVDFVCAPPS